MNTTNLLSPAVINTSAFLIVAMSILMVALHTSFLAMVTRRLPNPGPRQFLVPILAGVLLAAWLSWSLFAVSERVIAPEPPPLPHQIMQRPVFLGEMAVFVVLGITALLASKRVRALNAAMPSEWLIGIQSYRVLGEMFLWPYLASGALPLWFAALAGVGDVATGLAAPFVAWAVAHNKPGARQWAVTWNLFGILDLAVATTTAVLTHSTNIGRFPIVIVPLFLGPPIGVLTHIYSLRNLSVNQPAGESTCALKAESALA